MSMCSLPFFPKRDVTLITATLSLVRLVYTIFYIKANQRLMKSLLSFFLYGTMLRVVFVTLSSSLVSPPRRDFARDLFLHQPWSSPGTSGSGSDFPLPNIWWPFRTFRTRRPPRSSPHSERFCLREFTEIAFGWILTEFDCLYTKYINITLCSKDPYIFFNGDKGGNELIWQLFVCFPSRYLSGS